MSSRFGPHPAPDARGDAGGLAGGPPPAAGFAHHAGAATGRASLPDRASASMCRTGARGSVSQDFLTASLAFRAVRPGRRRTPPPSTPPRRADAQLYGTSSTTWVKLIRARADRRRQRLLGGGGGHPPSPPCAGPTYSHGEPAPGTRVATTDNGSDNVNSHDPNRNPRPRPSARRLAKEAATRARRLRRYARRHQPPPGPAALGKETP